MNQTMNEKDQDQDQGLVAFSWTNFLLSSIQHGIQSGHANADMIVKYRGTCDTREDMVMDWAMNHKTVNVRNGGDVNGLEEIVMLFGVEDNSYPWEYFEEDSSQSHLLTCVSIIVPERVYTYDSAIRIEDIGSGAAIMKDPLTGFDLELYNLIKTTRHAS